MSAPASKYRLWISLMMDGLVSWRGTAPVSFRASGTDAHAPSAQRHATSHFHGAAQLSSTLSSALNWHWHSYSIKYRITYSKKVVVALQLLCMRRKDIRGGIACHPTKRHILVGNWPDLPVSTAALRCAHGMHDPAAARHARGTTGSSWPLYWQDIIGSEAHRWSTSRRLRKSR